MSLQSSTRSRNKECSPTLYPQLIPWAVLHSRVCFSFLLFLSLPTCSSLFLCPGAAVCLSLWEGSVLCSSVDMGRLRWGLIFRSLFPCSWSIVRRMRSSLTSPCPIAWGLRCSRLGVWGRGQGFQVPGLARSLCGSLLRYWGRGGSIWFQVALCVSPVSLSCSAWVLRRSRSRGRGGGGSGGGFCCASCLLWMGGFGWGEGEATESEARKTYLDI